MKVTASPLSIFYRRFRVHTNTTQFVGRGPTSFTDFLVSGRAVLRFYTHADPFDHSVCADASVVPVREMWLHVQIHYRDHSDTLAYIMLDRVLGRGRTDSLAVEPRRRERFSDRESITRHGLQVLSFWEAIGDHGLPLHATVWISWYTLVGEKSRRVERLRAYDQRVQHTGVPAELLWAGE